MTKLQAIVFDLDDTLYPERAYVDSGLRQVAEWAADQLSLVSEEVHQELLQLNAEGNHGRLFDVWLQSRTLPLSYRATMLAVYRTHRPCIAPFPDVLGVLETLRASFRTGLVSDGYLPAQRHKFDALGLQPYFDAVVFSEQLGRAYWKPAPEPFQRVLTELGVPGHQTVYVGDNPTKDFGGARQAGLWSIRLRMPQGVYAHLQPASLDHAPDAEIRSVAELPRLLATWSPTGKHT